MAALGLAGLGPGEAAAAAQALALPAESFGNDPRLELAWALRAHQHAQIHFNLISSVDPKLLSLTRLDDRIYAEFRRSFPRLRVEQLEPRELKAQEAKEKWRPFCLSFQGLVEDFNLGTLLRLDSRRGYSEENSILATRIQFLAIEIARNREGSNDAVFGNSGNSGNSGGQEPPQAPAEPPNFGSHNACTRQQTPRHQPAPADTPGGRERETKTQTQPSPGPKKIT